MTTKESAPTLQNLHFNFLREFFKLRGVIQILESIAATCEECDLAGATCILEDTAKKMQELCDQLDGLAQ